MRLIVYVARVTPVTVKCVTLTGGWELMLYTYQKHVKWISNTFSGENIIVEIASIIFYFENGIKYMYKDFVIQNSTHLLKEI
jgi:hypothetical protein